MTAMMIIRMLRQRKAARPSFCRVFICTFQRRWTGIARTLCAYSVLEIERQVLQVQRWQETQGWGRILLSRSVRMSRQIAIAPTARA